LSVKAPELAELPVLKDEITRLSSSLTRSFCEDKLKSGYP